MRGVEAGLTPGGILVYGADNANIDTIPFGQTETMRPEKALTVTADTVYDVASITKIAATTASIMKLVEAGSLDLDQPVTAVIPEITPAGAEAMRIRHLLGHASGFPAHLNFYERLLAGERLGAATPREALLRMVGSTPLAYETGTKTLYSDLGFITLGFIIERVTGERLDAAAARLVFEPLAMKATQFVDLAASPPAPRPNPIVPTELCPYRGLVVGEVHDDNAHSAGGICGHAGVFSTGPDLEKLAQALNSAFNHSASAHFDSAIVRHFATTSAAPNTTRALGFDRPEPEPGASAAGDLWSRDGFGHMGFTGCAMWMDPPRGRYVILLTNRVHPSRDKVGIKPFRRKVIDAVVTTLSAT